MICRVAKVHLDPTRLSQAQFGRHSDLGDDPGRSGEDSTDQGCRRGIVHLSIAVAERVWWSCGIRYTGGSPERARRCVYLRSGEDKGQCHAKSIYDAAMLNGVMKIPCACVRGCQLGLQYYSYQCSRHSGRKRPIAGSGRGGQPCPTRGNFVSTFSSADPSTEHTTKRTLRSIEQLPALRRRPIARIAGRRRGPEQVPDCRDLGFCHCTIWQLSLIAHTSRPLA